MYCSWNTVDEETPVYSAGSLVEASSGILRVSASAAHGRVTRHPPRQLKDECRVTLALARSGGADLFVHHRVHALGEQASAQLV